MKDLGNRIQDSTIDFTFHSHQSDGTPASLAGTPSLAIYKGDNIDEANNGVSLTTDFDSRVGLNHVRIDTASDDFYQTANDYTVVISQGTVAGIDVAGVPVAMFSIENRAGGTAGSSTVSSFSASALNQLAGLDVQLVSTVSDDGLVSIVRGDDYAAIDGRAITITNNNGTWPDLTGAVVHLTAKLDDSILTATGTVIEPTGIQRIEIELTNEQTNVKPGIWDYDIQATLASGNVVTLQMGRLQIHQDITV